MKTKRKTFAEESFSSRKLLKRRKEFANEKINTYTHPKVRSLIDGINRMLGRTLPHNDNEG